MGSLSDEEELKQPMFNPAWRSSGSSMTATTTHTDTDRATSSPTYSSSYFSAASTREPIKPNWTQTTVPRPTRQPVPPENAPDPPKEWIPLPPPIERPPGLPRPRAQPFLPPQIEPNDYINQWTKHLQESWDRAPSEYAPLLDFPAFPPGLLPPPAVRPPAQRRAPRCMFCHQRTHYASDCLVFPNLASRQALIQQKGLCQKCLYNHEGPCTSQGECFYCRRSNMCNLPAHNTALCPIRFAGK